MSLLSIINLIYKYVIKSIFLRLEILETEDFFLPRLPFGCCSVSTDKNSIA